MADILTFEEHRGPIRGRKIAWSGDYNNVLSSWIDAAARFGFELEIACPAELQPSGLAHRAGARRAGARIVVSEDPERAVTDAAAVISDCWVSMGDEDAGRRHNLLAPYQVNAKLMRHAEKDAIFMHCLPAHRGEEVTDEVIDGPNSVVFDEAENRLHAQKGHSRLVPGSDSRMNVGNAHRLRRRPRRHRHALHGRGSVHPRACGAPRRDARRDPEAARLPARGRRASRRRPRRSRCCSASSLKQQGRFQLQTQSDGPVSMVLVDFDAPSNLRALGAIRRKGAGGAPRRRGRSARQGLSRLHHRAGRPFLALSGRRGARRTRAAKRGAATISTVPSRSRRLVRVAVGETLTSEGPSWRAGGLIAQFLPESEERRRRADLDPGDAPPGHEVADRARGRRLDRGQGARGHDRGSRVARPDAVERTSALSAVSRARRARVPADAARRRLPLLGRPDRRDAAEFFARANGRR